MYNFTFFQDLQIYSQFKTLMDSSVSIELQHIVNKSTTVGSQIITSESRYEPEPVLTKSDTMLMLQAFRTALC